MYRRGARGEHDGPGLTASSVPTKPAAKDACRTAFYPEESYALPEDASYIWYRQTDSLAKAIAMYDEARLIPCWAVSYFRIYVAGEQ